MLCEVVKLQLLDCSMLSGCVGKWLAMVQPDQIDATHVALLALQRHHSFFLVESLRKTLLRRRHLDNVWRNRLLSEDPDIRLETISPLRVMASGGTVKPALAAQDAKAVSTLFPWPWLDSGSALALAAFIGCFLRASPASSGLAPCSLKLRGRPTEFGANILSQIFLQFSARRSNSWALPKVNSSALGSLAVVCKTGSLAVVGPPHGEKIRIWICDLAALLMSGHKKNNLMKRKRLQC